MKKFLLFAAAALTASLAFAQSTAEGGWENMKNRPDDKELGKNYVVNGGFDDPAYETNGNPYGSWYPVEIDEATKIPNWFLSTGGCWNGVVQIKTQTPDDYMIFEGNTQYLDMVNCTVNGWTKIKAQTIVTGLTPGKVYTLDMYACHQFSNPTEWGNPDHGFNIYGKDPSGQLTHEVAITEDVKDEEGNVIETIITGYRTEPMLGALLYANNELSEEAEWEYLKYTFTPTEDAVFLEIWTCNYTGEGNQSGLCWADFDEIRVYDESELGGIANVDADKSVAVEYYTLQGVRMPADAALHGTFIAKRGNKASKVYIR